MADSNRVEGCSSCLADIARFCRSHENRAVDTELQNTTNISPAAEIQILIHFLIEIEIKTKQSRMDKRCEKVREKMEQKSRQC